MRQNAGERLFALIGEIPEEMVLEADQDGLQDQAGDNGLGHGNIAIDLPEAEKNAKTKVEIEMGVEIAAQNTKMDTPDKDTSFLRSSQAQSSGFMHKPDDTSVSKSAPESMHTPDDTSVSKSAPESMHTPDDTSVSKSAPDLSQTPDSDFVYSGIVSKHTDTWSKHQPKRCNGRTFFGHKAGEYLKYLPVAVCLSMVFAGAYYVVNHSFRAGSDDAFYMNDSDGSKSDQKAEDAVAAGENRDDGFTSENGGLAGINGSSEPAAGSDDAKEMAGDAGLQLPVRYDAYEGPVVAMTATGDTHNLKTSRQLKCKVSVEKGSESSQPLLHISDQYAIKNTSKEDKTFQLVYPFASTLNLAYEMDQEILQIQGRKHSAVKYEIGESILACRRRGLSQGSAMAPGGYQGYEAQQAEAAGASSMEDYERLFDQEGEYQKNALAKEADWEREVSVYTFSDFQMGEDAQKRNNPAVVGVTVYGADADVLTCGFAHSSVPVDEVANHCFFFSENQARLMLVVTGKQDREPAIGYYSNLDCEEEIEGVQCTMQKQKMTYSDALQLCAAAVAKQTLQDYGQDVYAGELPEYFNASAAYQALTMLSGEDEFYDILLAQYGSTELREVCEKLFGETRLIYAMSTVTIPAKKTLKVAAHIQKRQSSAFFTIPEQDVHDDMQKETYGYDFLNGTKSLINGTKTNIQLYLPKSWKLAKSSLNFKRKKAVWIVDTKADVFHIAVSP